MSVRHALRRHGRSSRTYDHASRGVNYALRRTGGTADGSMLTCLQQALRAPIWRTEELTLLRVYGIAVMLHVVVVGLVLFQTLVFGF